MSQLNPGSRQVNLLVKVISKGEPKEIASRRDGSIHRVADVLVGDDTGCIIMSLWDDNIERVGPSDTLHVRNAYVSLFRGSMRLNIGRFGSLEASGESIGEVNTENNLSDKQFEQPQRRQYDAPRFKPFYRGDDNRRRRRFSRRY